MAKNTKRKIIGMVSKASGHRSYYTVKNTQNTTEKLSLRKYDPVTRKHELYEETKKSLGRNEVKKRKS
ncbi:MAG: 50S ribosomal protein L33 [Candidatus Saccharimonadales bacterium]